MSPPATAFVDTCLNRIVTCVDVPRALRSRDELLKVTGRDDAFGRLDLSERLTQAWTRRGAVGVVRRPAGHDVSLMVWGSPYDLDGLLAAMFHDGSLPLEVRGVTVPAGRAEHLPALRQRGDVAAGVAWDWMWTDAAPAVPAVDDRLRLVDLHDTGDAAEIAALGHRENPRFEGWPGRGLATRWVGVRDATGGLVACGAVHRRPSGAAHLGGILVTAAHRGLGLGRLVTAELTARVVAEEGVCTLSMYADNTVARSLYHDLGYRTDQRWLSLPLAPA